MPQFAQVAPHSVHKLNIYTTNDFDYQTHLINEYMVIIPSKNLVYSDARKLTTWVNDDWNVKLGPVEIWKYQIGHAGCSFDGVPNKDG